MFHNYCCLNNQRFEGSVSEFGSQYYNFIMGSGSYDDEYIAGIFFTFSLTHTISHFEEAGFRTSIYVS